MSVVNYVMVVIGYLFVWAVLLAGLFVAVCIHNEREARQAERDHATRPLPRLSVVRDLDDELADLARDFDGGLA